MPNIEFTYIDDVTNTPTTFQQDLDRMNTETVLDAVTGRWGGRIDGVPAALFHAEVFHVTLRDEGVLQCLFIFVTDEKAPVACKIVGFAREVK